ncbi:hypothetical protein [Romboutsia lituseburensis]|uniref:Uncharacterized protein n=2 Tax=root TaxID=1 RepID=A0A1G9SGC5_9FIRM|nr:hypothetical protein [Romboutsia lituseburensis]MCR8745693.1 hypothetical protein [Romboutsia lituseburensis]CEH35862.1 Hypothetical protein RLITU_3295 [Romboutsia lituseburensis]SDM34390.1 hypothetical protein SAMN04515677_109104 [Romboutsia lituseburensis DSM 797]
MRMYSRRSGYRRGTENNIPNVLAFTMIRNFLSDSSYSEMRKEYFINNLNSNQVNQVMKDIKGLFKEYKGLDVVTIETQDGDINKIIL